jgi:vacuolar protein sorting-associated protein 13B
VHKSVAIKLAHNLTSPKWKDGCNSEVVTLDEDAFVDAEIRLGAFPGHQKVRSKLSLLFFFKHFLGFSHSK